MKKSFSKKIAALLCVMMLFSCFGTNVFAATNSQIYDSYGSYCTVQLTNKKAAKVTLRVKDMWPGWNNNATVHIKLTDGDGNWLKEWNATGNSTFTLGTDHRTYRIYVCHYYKPSSYWNNNWNFTNTGKAYRWVIENPKNCTIS